MPAVNLKTLAKEFNYAMPQTSKSYLKLVGEKPAETAIKAENFSAWFGENCVLSGVTTQIAKGRITCIVGPSGSGKSTFLRSINRINDSVPRYKMHGSLSVEGLDLDKKTSSLTQLRAQVGMVFQKPCVFPRSIKENVLFGLRGHKISRTEKDQIVEQSLKSAALWNEVHLRLDQSATTLSLGQQQRLCIARALAVKPKILLLDEPTASVDPVSGRSIESLILKLKHDYTIIMVTHDIRQTKRIADDIMFFCSGALIECGTNEFMFSKECSEQSRLYLDEAFCEC